MKSNKDNTNPFLVNNSNRPVVQNNSETFKDILEKVFYKIEIKFKTLVRICFLNLVKLLFGYNRDEYFKTNIN